MLQNEVPEREPLIERLSRLYPDTSKNTLKQWITHGRVHVDGKPCLKGNLDLEKGQTIELLPKMQLLKEGIQVLYEDAHLVVIHKPYGLLSVAEDIEKNISVHRILKEKHARVFPVHRLDRETSGVMVFAFTEACRDGFKELFFNHHIKREYRALVEGNFKETEGMWHSYLQEDEFGYVHSQEEATGGGKLATTHYKVVRQGKRTALLTLTLETGRKNQIRAHATDAGHPIVGDKKYGSQFRDHFRVMLHAVVLGFVHPITAKPLEFFVLPEPAFNSVF